MPTSASSEGRQTDTDAPAEMAWEARRLLRASRAGVLGTLAEDAPFLSLVTPATAPDLSVLMLLSSLAKHRRNLERNARCSLLVQGTASSANPQTAPRLSLSGRAEAVSGEEAEALRARWLALHPYAAGYAGFADFALFRLVPAAAHYVGGFGRARHLSMTDLLPAPEAVAAIAAAAGRIAGHCNADHADALDAIAVARGATGGGWRMVGVDIDGFDLAQGEQVLRVPFAAPVTTTAEVRAALVAMTENTAPR